MAERFDLTMNIGAAKPFVMTFRSGSVQRAIREAEGIAMDWADKQPGRAIDVWTILELRDSDGRLIRP